MRKVVLTTTLVALLTLPVLAQPGAGMFRGMDGSMLLASPDVQKELKLSDDQKEALSKAQAGILEAMQKARKDKSSTEGSQKAMQEYREAVDKVRGKLESGQKKRLLGIEAQVAERMSQPRIFTRAEVQSALKMTGKQKELVKELMSEMEKDVRELMEDARGNREKMMAAFKKMGTMGKERYTKITKSLSAEQKEAWKELQGEKIELRLGGFGPGGKERPKREKKNDL